MAHEASRLYKLGHKALQLAVPGRVRTVRVMLSSGGVSLTDLCEPTHTVTAAVNTMFRFAGTVISDGATATSARQRCDNGQGSLSVLAASCELLI